MEEMNPIIRDKQYAEVDFWRGFHGSLGHEAFVRVRMKDFDDKTRFFPGIHEEVGVGLDLACGLISIFEFSDRKVVAVDALLDEYRAILPLEGTLDVRYQKEDGENLSFADETFDWVFCCNAIDHTPNPSKMVSEIRRVLKPGGRLYFEVHFDPALYAPHYQLWRRDTVDEHLREFKMFLGIEEWWEEHQKYLFWGEYRK